MKNILQVILCKNIPAFLDKIEWHLYHSGTIDEGVESGLAGM
jgi:hypothetical protein